MWRPGSHLDPTTADPAYPSQLHVGTTSCLVSIITIMPSDLCRPVRFVVTIWHAAPRYWTTQEEPFSRRGQAVMYTCDHQTTSLGTKADHERGFALEKASVRSKHPLFRGKRVFSYYCVYGPARYLGGKFAELNLNLLSSLTLTAVTRAETNNTARQMY